MNPTNTLFDFTLSTTYDRLEVRLTSAMPQAEAERWVRCYERILSVMLEDPAQEIDKYILLDEDERNRLFEGFNDTRVSYPKDATLVSLFEEQAARQGDRVAVKRGERVLTYRELNEEANRLAHALRERGLAREEVVGLHFDRTPEMIIALLAVLKAGGAYLPVDPTYPEERKSFMLTDGGVRFLLAESRENLPDFAGEVWVSGELDLKGYPRENPHPVNEARDLCYILYTSGSTGQPKGVMTTHRNVVRTMVNNGFLEVTPEDRVLQLSNYAFDGSTLEIYSALLFGAPLILLPKEEVLNVRRLAQVILKEEESRPHIHHLLPVQHLVDWDVNALHRHAQGALRRGSKPQANT